jgi:integrase
MDVYSRRKVSNKNAHELMQVTAKPSQLIENSVMKNDVFFTPTSETPEDIGRVYVIEETLNNTVYSYHLMRFRPNQGTYYPNFPNYSLMTGNVRKQFFLAAKGVQRYVISKADFESIIDTIPEYREQAKIGEFFRSIDSLITLHQRKFYKNIEKDFKMQRRHKLFVDYYENWIKLYKEGAVKNVTLKKYYLTLTWLKKLVPNLKTNELTRTIYQQLLNDYAKTHEKQTTMDFHHQLKGSILDAVDEGLIANDPTRKVIIKGKKPKEKKIKYLNQFQLQTLISNLNLSSKINADWLILIIAKTGMRFSEALGLTAKDFDYANQTISINKTWDYKGIGGFQETKNKSSIRKIQIDWKTVTQFAGLLNNLDKNKPIFIDGKTYNSTINQILARHCKRVNIPQISIHGLRHTHASLLLYSGVSIASVARRLGHASMTTTQKIYLHVI